MGRPSTVRFGGRRGVGDAASKRARTAPSVLSFRAVNQVLQNVLQVRLRRGCSKLKGTDGPTAYVTVVPVVWLEVTHALA